MDDIAIKVENLSKVYKLYDKPIDRLKEALSLTKKKYHKEHYALNNINFEIKKGTSVGIIGKNGSGKSTLLKIITGVLTQSSGNVVVNGKVSALLELGAGFNPEYTGVDNIYLNGSMMGYSKEEIDKKLQSIIDFADIGDFIYQQVKTYSSGMFVRLAFAVAINVDPDILIVDEALAVGDSQFQLKCINRIKEFIHSGKTVFFVTHDGYTIKNLCNLGIWIDKGNIECIGDADYVVNEYERNIERIKENIKELQDINSDRVKIHKIDFIQNSIVVKTNSIRNNNDLRIYMEYESYEDIRNIVIGIAIFKFDGTYVCGLNTKLDNVELYINKGFNNITILYNKLSLLPGTYYIDVGFFEKSGVGRLGYKKRAKEFTVNSEQYKGEGIVILDHSWIV